MGKHAGQLDGYEAQQVEINTRRLEKCDVDLSATYGRWKKRNCSLSNMAEPQVARALGTVRVEDHPLRDVVAASVLAGREMARWAESGRYAA